MAGKEGKRCIISLVLFCILISGCSSQNFPYPFSLGLAYKQLMLSYAAYCPYEQLLNWDCYFCKNYTAVHGDFVPIATIYNESTNIFGYVGYSGTIAQVLFRGTLESSLDNWIDDLTFSKTVAYSDIDGAYVHSGFYESWLSVRQQVYSALKIVTNEITPTEYYFSGHSLGAAISILAAIDVFENVDQPIICYNFGEPRVGNSVFANYFNVNINTTYRITNNRDIVPHLPPMDLGFYHVPTEVWYNASWIYRVCDNSGEDPTCSDSLSVDLSIDDHLDYLGIPLSLGQSTGCQ